MPTIDEAIRLIQRRMSALQEVLADAKSRIDGKELRTLTRSLKAAQHTLEGLKRERDKRIDADIHGGLKRRVKVGHALTLKKKK